jgi:hypothetical protein
MLAIRHGWTFLRVVTDRDAVRVECYSGHTYAQDPRALVWQGQRYPIAQVESSWRSPEGPVFQVLTEPGDRFELVYHEVEGVWQLRRLPAMGNSDPISSQMTDEEVKR